MTYYQKKKILRNSILESKKNKKANVMLDGGFFLIIIFIFIVITISVYPLFKEINDDIQADDDMSNTTKQVMQDKLSQYPSTFDNVFIMVLVVMWALVMIASWNIDAHPVFFIFTAVITLFLIIGSASLSNYYEEFSADDEYSSYIYLFPMMNYVGSHLAHAIVVIIASISIALFAKTRQG